MYLWDPKKILHEDQNFIWGLLEDIRLLYKVSTSATPSSQRTPARTPPIGSAKMSRRPS